MKIERKNFKETKEIFFKDIKRNLVVLYFWPILLIRFIWKNNKWKLWLKIILTLTFLLIIIFFLLLAFYY